MAKRLIAMLLCIIMILSMAACGKQESANAPANSESSGTPATETPEEDNGPKEIVNLSLYPADAKLISGTVTGYRADFFAEHGIALDIWAYSEEKTNAILASGALPDIMYVADKDLPTMIEGGMVLCLDDLLDKIPNIEKYDALKPVLEYMRQYKSAGTGSVYGLPLNVGDSIVSNDTDRYAVKILWDVYEELGYPEINSFDDLIDVMAQMKEAHPTDADGNVIFGTVLNGGGDSAHFGCMQLWDVWQGYMNTDQKYFLERNMVDGVATSIFEEDSVYKAGLKFYNEIYRRGLLDEDSINIDRATQAPKIDNGLAYVPGGTLPGWAPKYYQVYIPGTQIYYNPGNPYGTTQTLCINANTTNLDACLEFLNMWIDPYTYFVLNYGPEGDAWYIDGDKMLFTDKFNEYRLGNGNAWNGYKFDNGEEMAVFNCNFVLNHGTAYLEYKDEDGNPRARRFENWAEWIEASNDVETFKKWQEFTGYDTWLDLLNDKNAFTRDSALNGIDAFLSLPDDVMQLNVDVIKDVVVNASWQMIYAKSEAEFEAIWAQMVADAMELGAQDIIEWRLADIENAKAIRDSIVG